MEAALRLFALAAAAFAFASPDTKNMMNYKCDHTRNHTQYLAEPTSNRSFPCVLLAKLCLDLLLLQEQVRVVIALALGDLDSDAGSNNRSLREQGLGVLNLVARIS